MCEDVISVIVPVYNDEEHLSRCIESVLKQSYEAIELIVVNDGSKDDTGKICDEYASRDARVKVVHKKNEGAVKARKDALEIATGEYVTFLDSDDYMTNDIIAKCVVYQKECGADIICFNSLCNGKEIFDIREKKSIEKNEAVRQLFIKKMLDGNTWSKMYKKQLLEGIEFPIGPTSEDLLQDHKVVYQAIQKSKKVAMLPEVGYVYERRAESITNDIHFKQSHLNAIFATREFCNEVINTYPELRDEANYYNFLSAIFTNVKIEKDYSIPKTDDRYIVLKEMLKEQYDVVRKSKFLSLRDRLDYFLLYTGLFRMVYKIYNSLKR